MKVEAEAVPGQLNDEQLSEDQLSKIIACFEMFDTDGSHDIGLQELNIAIEVSQSTLTIVSTQDL